MNAEDFAARLVASLQGQGEKKNKDWWEKYLKHVISFHGIPMAKLRALVDSFWSKSSLGSSSSIELKKDVAFELWKCKFSEEKLSGTLIYEKLVSELTLDDVAKYFATALRAGYLCDWNNVDWLCMKVLGRLVARGRDFCEAIAHWTMNDAEPIWLRRAGVVAFVWIASKRNYEGFAELVLTAAANNLKSQERFE